jgi:hypothetical protein
LNDRLKYFWGATAIGLRQCSSADKIVTDITDKPSTSEMEDTNDDENKNEKGKFISDQEDAKGKPDIW